MSFLLLWHESDNVMDNFLVMMVTWIIAEDLRLRWPKMAAAHQLFTWGTEDTEEFVSIGHEPWLVQFDEGCLIWIALKATLFMVLHY